MKSIEALSKKNPRNLGLFLVNWKETRREVICEYQNIKNYHENNYEIIQYKHRQYIRKWNKAKYSKKNIVIKTNCRNWR